MRRTARLLLVSGALAAAWSCAAGPSGPPAGEPRLEWWREARFGLFVHWGLYAIPAGCWGEGVDHGEWIRTTARIPREEYARFVPEFRPEAFDAAEWARLADEAGMKYVVITTKHHDGFALFDSAVSEFDVAATPWRRDVMAEIARGFGERGLRVCWYHSIMDWNHPDYLPRRDWELAGRPAEGADFDRYVAFLHAQVTELLTKYGPIGVMWFDGEWESTWNHERGQALYDLCRRLQPDVIVNNRVDVGRGGMAGLTEGPGYAGDFGTPEQEVPATGLPGVDWESCITMNRHWGWNAADEDWKSTTELVRLLVDVVSKGGNLLLNVGPRADGSLPPRAVERLQGIGRWMKLHGEAIHGTEASPFDALPWGRCTLKRDGGDTRLFLHVFDWPQDGRLVVPGIGNDSFSASLLADGRALPSERAGDAVWIWLPERPTDPDCPVVELRLAGEPIVYLPPRIEAPSAEFVNPLEVRLETGSATLAVRYTLDGRDPGPADPIATGPIRLRDSAIVSARAFHGGRAVSPVVRREFRRAAPLSPDYPLGHAMEPGIERLEAVGVEWDSARNWEQSGEAGGATVHGLDPGDFLRRERVALCFRGWLRIPADGMWSFSLTSDDGSILSVGDRVAVDNDGLHAPQTRSGSIPLAAGWHRFELSWFNRTGGTALDLRYARDGERFHEIPAVEFGAPAAAGGGPRR